MIVHLKFSHCKSFLKSVILNANFWLLFIKEFQFCGLGYQLKNNFCRLAIDIDFVFFSIDEHTVFLAPGVY